MPSLTSVLLSVLLITMIYSSDSYSQALCQNLFTNSLKLSHDARERVISEINSKYATKSTEISIIGNLIKNIYISATSEIIFGKQTPNWNHFDSMAAIQITLAQKVKEMPDKSLLHQFYQELNSSLSPYSTKKDRKTIELEIEKAEISYGPIDYGLRLAFQAQLQGLNPYLPTNLRFIEIKLPADQNKESLKTTAQKIVKSLKNLHRRLLKKQIADKPSVLRKKLLLDKEIEPFLNELKNDGFEFAICRPDIGRFWIEKVGFHNQHVTGSSMGYMGNLGRNAVEASYIGKTTEKYAEFDNDLKPKYGFLIRNAMPLEFIRTTSWYGNDVYYIKKQNVIDRVTFTLGDSLNAMRGYWSSGESSKPTEWDHVFTPWDFKEMVALYLKNLAVKSLKFQLDGEPKTIERSHWHNEYVELQYWGPLTLNDVHTFVFKTKPPSGPFLKALLDHNIKIFDGSKGEPFTPWSNKE